MAKKTERKRLQELIADLTAEIRTRNELDRHYIDLFMERNNKIVKELLLLVRIQMIGILLLAGIKIAELSGLIP